MGYPWPDCKLWLRCAVFHVSSCSSLSFLFVAHDNKTYYIAQPVNCVGSWTTEGQCSKSCGTGQVKQTYSVSTTAANGGTECEAADGATRYVNCGTNACRMSFVALCCAQMADVLFSCPQHRAVATQLSSSLLVGAGPTSC